MSQTKILKVDPASPDEKAIEFAATLLRNGGLVAFPTETVYGIGANLFNKKAIKKLYEIKKRPLNKPFTVHISSVGMITEMHCEIPPFAAKLIKEFWPGPLTLILGLTGVSTPGVGRGKIGFRMPKNRIAKDLIRKSGVPVAAPSANISGEKPSTEAGDVIKAFDGQVDLVLDAGKTEFEKESTIIDTTVSPYKILRVGAIPAERITDILNTDSRGFLTD